MSCDCENGSPILFDHVGKNYFSEILFSAEKPSLSVSANLTKTDTRLCLFRVATVREKSGENEHFSRTGKSQGKSLISSKSVKSQGILFSFL